MNPDLTTYSQRADAIAEILGGVIDLSKYAVTTHSSNPEDLELTNGLWCSWGDPEFGLPRIAVCINAVDDIHGEIRKLRDHVADYPLRGESHYDPASASELSTDRPDEYAFLFDYVDDLTVLVGQCRVTVMPSLQQIKRMDHDYPDLALADFVDAALEIGRTIGCSPYQDDFVRPDFPKKWARHGWTAFPTPPPED